MIICLLLPYFAAHLARRERAVPQNVPLILHAGEKVAATCDSVAARGVTFGMSLRQAKWLCPDAQVIPLNLQVLKTRTDETLQIQQKRKHARLSTLMRGSPPPSMWIWSGCRGMKP